MRSFAAILLFLTPLPAAAADYVGDAPVALLLDTYSDTTLYEREADRRIPTASMAKMMTAYVTFNALADGRIDANKKVQVRPAIWRRWNNAGSTMFLRAGEQVSVDNLLFGVLTLSGNDASVVLAEGVAGSEAAFVAAMNAAARKLGMVKTHFANATGWPDGGKTYSTARDLATLAQAIILEHPALYTRYFGRDSFRWSNVTQPNRNPLLGAVEGADGLKTGHSEAAGYCLAGTAKRGNRRLIMILAGLPTQQLRISEARELMNWGFDEWQAETLFREGQEVIEAPVQLGTVDRVSLVAPWSFNAVRRAGEQDRPKLQVRYYGPLKAPIAKGEQIGELLLRYPDGRVHQLPLRAGAAVAKAGFFGRVWNGMRVVLAR